MSIHIPVLVAEVLDAFKTLPNKSIILDATLGGAGHTKALLEAYPKIRILGCDQDQRAIEAAKKFLKKDESRLELIHSKFEDLFDESTLNNLPVEFQPPWNGVLLDLGYSSDQLESIDYGMSFQKDAPLDMRLARPVQGKSAWELLNESSDQELSEILRAYGEVKDSRFFAKKIHQAIGSGKVVNSTNSLAHFIKTISKEKKAETHPATKAFQALRIAVNDELRVLDQFLNHLLPNLSSQARIAIITFHSIEDRLVKQWGNVLIQKDRIKMVTKKPKIPSVEETKVNPRSRSAKLRVYEVL